MFCMLCNQQIDRKPDKSQRDAEKPREQVVPRDTKDEVLYDSTVSLLN